MSADRQREFVDTNILVYAHDVSAGEKNNVAQQIIRDLWDAGSGCLSIQILQEFYVTVTRKVFKPLSVHDAEDIIRDLSYWHVHSPSAADVLGAIDLQQHYGISFWDAMVLHSAICLKCSVLLSEDLAHGQVYEGVEVKNPFLAR